MTEKETTEEALGDLYDYDSYLEEKKTKVKKQVGIVCVEQVLE